MFRTIDEILDRFPKKRPPLSDAQKVVYVREYQTSRGNQLRAINKIAQKVETWMHHQVKGQGESILEIGGGALNHIPFEKDYIHYDVIEPFSELYLDSKFKNVPNKIFTDISEIALQPSYNRIISVAVLEHLEDLPQIIARCGLLLQDGGSFSSGIPTEGGFLWGLSWRLTTGFTYRLRTGLSYGEVIAHEHVNDCDEIIAIIKHFFNDVKLSRFPALGYHGSLFTRVLASSPKKTRCQQFLDFIGPRLSPGPNPRN